MPRFIQATRHPERKALAFLETARAFYGEAFGARTTKDLAEAMAEWGELSEDEQTFAVAHLLYLNLLAQGAVVRMLDDARGLLDEVAEELHEAMDAGAEVEPRRDEPGAEDEDDDERDVFVDGGDGDEDDAGVEDEPVPAAPPAPAPEPPAAPAPEAPTAEPGGAS